MAEEKTSETPNKEEHDFTYEIGAITVKCALLEGLIQNCANILIGGEGAGIATAKLSFQNLLDILWALYDETPYIPHENKDFSKLESLLSSASTAADERNKIVHSIWYIHVDDLEKPFRRVKMHTRRKQGIKIDRERMNVNDLRDVIGKLDYAIDTAQEFTNQVLAFYGSSLLLSPADGAEVGPQPELNWSDLRFANGYELAISRDPYFTINESPVKRIIKSKYKCTHPLEHGVTYYWRVRPFMATTWGLWSEIRRFTVK